MKVDKAQMAKADAYANSSGLTALTYRIVCTLTLTICDPHYPPKIIDSKKLAKEVGEILKSH